MFVGDVLLGNGVELALLKLAEPDMLGVPSFETDPKILILGLEDSETKHV